MEQNVIEVKNLRKKFLVKQKEAGFVAGLKNIFGPTYREVEAVDDISFDVKRGELLAFIGPNGAGKSTTIKMLTGILWPTSGELSVLGSAPVKERSKLSYKIGSVFGQKAQLWFHLPAIDSFILFARMYELDNSQFERRLKYLTEALEIGEYLRTPVRKLSLGERMRCEIAASLLHSPEILFLDEPTIGLDVIAKQHIREVIQHLNKTEGVTIFLTSHDAGDIEALAKRTMVINHGTICFDGSTESFKRKYVRTKTVEIVIEEDTESFKFVGGKILEQGKFNLKVELDTETASIERLLDYAVRNFTIRDINIFEPEMESIIAMIYREQRQLSGGSK